jgi:hydrogenase 3 maturation protease
VTVAVETRRVAVVGVGQLLRGDDAAGVVVARRLRARQLPPEWLVVDAGPSPENCTGPLRAFRPDLVVFVDAAEMGERPGAVRWLDPRDAEGCGASTHSLPLNVVADYLAAELGCEVRLLGVQPAGDELGASFSPAVRRAVGRIVAELARDAAEGRLS